MTPTCSKCRRPIHSDDINVPKNVAYCRECNIAHRFSELTFGHERGAYIDLDHPPNGAWFVHDHSGTIIGATHRNLVNCVGFLFFALFWNGLLSVFVSFAISSTLHNLQVPLPEWVPVPIMEGGGADTFTVLIETREGKQIKLGSLLTNERRQFILSALQQVVGQIV